MLKHVSSVIWRETGRQNIPQSIGQKRSCFDHVRAQNHGTFMQVPENRDARTRLDDMESSAASNELGEIQNCVRLVYLERSTASLMVLRVKF